MKTISPHPYRLLRLLLRAAAIAGLGSSAFAQVEIIATTDDGFLSLDSAQVSEVGKVVFIGERINGSTGVYVFEGGLTTFADETNGFAPGDFDAAGVSPGGQVAFVANDRLYFESDADSHVGLPSAQGNGSALLVKGDSGVVDGGWLYYSYELNGEEQWGAAPVRPDSGHVPEVAAINAASHLVVSALHQSSNTYRLISLAHEATSTTIGFTDATTLVEGFLVEELGINDADMIFYVAPDGLWLTSFGGGAGSRVESPLFDNPRSIAMNNAGQLAFEAAYHGWANPDYQGDSAVLRWDGGTVVRIIGNGDSVSNEFLFDDGAPASSRALTADGRVLIHGSLRSKLDGRMVEALLLAAGVDEPPPPPPTDGHRWINTSGGSFGTASNWNPAEVPGVSDNAIFDASGSYSVDVGDRTIARLLVGGEPSLHVMFTNANLTTAATSLEELGVVINHGNFTLNDGTMRGVHGIVGSSSATQATIASGLWDNQATLTIGGGGEATMLVADNGRVRAPIVRVGNAANGAFGSVSLDAGTLEAAQLDIGRAGTGTLAIENGGTATVSPVLFSQLDPNDPLYQLLVGVGESGSSGHLVVRGVHPDSNQPSTLSVIDVTTVIGAGGANAQIVIDDGGFVEMTPGVVLGQGGGSIATLTVRGEHEGSGLRSTLVVNDLGSNELLAGDLSIAGFEGRAEMQIDGGLVESTRGEVGNAAGLPGLGLVEIINQGLWEVEEDLVLAGDSGTSLTVSGGLLRIGDLQETWDPLVAFTPILSIGGGVPGGGGEGTLRLTGFFSDLQLAPRGIRVGENGTGELIIEAGARLSGAFQLYTTQVNEQEPGAADVLDRATIRVTGFSPDAGPEDPAARSTLQLESTTGLSGIGINDRAEMFIENGAVVACALVGVGGQPATRGRLVVDGTGNGLPSTLIASEWITVGDLAHGGGGTMEVSNGAVVSTRELTVEGSGIVFFDAGGGIIVGDGDVAVPNVLRLNSGGWLEGNGTLVGRLEDNGGVDNFAGTVLPGTSPGTLTIEGHYWQGVDGVLEIELGGLESGFDYDVLAVSGTATFAPGTTIRIILIDPNPDDDIDEVFIPRTGDDFGFLVADDVVLPPGETLNDLVEFTNLPAGVEIDLQLDVVNGETVVTAETTAAPAPPPGPRITAHPKDVTATAGSPLELSVGVDGASNVAYQWRFNGEDLPGATAETFELPSTQSFHAGDYSVVIMADGTAVESRIATVAVAAAPANNARLLNLSTRGLAQTGDDILIPGFVIGGTGTKRLLIRAVGPTLKNHPYNIASALENPRMVLKRLDASLYVDVDANDDWLTNDNAADIADAIDDLSAFEFEDDREAALLVDLAPGQYTVFADGVPSTGSGQGATGIAIVELYDAEPAVAGPATTLANISNRGFVGTGEAVMIPGFVISSGGPKTLLIRVVGPTLAAAPYNVPGTMADPKLEIFPEGAQTPILANDNWSDNPAAANTTAVATQVGAFALAEGSADAALVVTLAPGTYTVVGSSADGTSTGVVLVEVYVVP